MNTQKTALGEVTPGPRSFPIIYFTDHNGQECSLQLSSLIGDMPASGDLDDLDEVSMAFPGSSFIWLGKGAHRMHLGREQVRELSERLNEWLDTGKIL